MSKLFWAAKKMIQKNPIHPVAIMTAMIIEIVVVEIMKAATDSAPMYIAAKEVKKRARNPPAAAKDIIKEMMIAFTVATKRMNMKNSNPVKARSVIDPTEMTRRARSGLPRRVQRRRSRAEFLEATRRRGALFEAEDRIRWIRGSESTPEERTPAT